MSVDGTTNAGAAERKALVAAAGCPGNELPGRSQGSPFQNSQNHRASICSTRSAKMATNDNCSSSRTDLLDKKIPRPRSLVLHSYFRSSCAWRVRIALESKGLKYTYREVNIREDIPEGKQQHTDEFRALNPLSQVPVLQVYESGELVANLTQSMAIMEYIDESFSGVNLLPKDLLQRAQCRALCQLIVSGIQPIQNLGTLNKLEPDQRQEWARYFINKGFEALERMLSDRVFVTGCCISEQVTLADFCLVPQVYNARRFGVDMSRFPKIVAVDAHLATLEAFIRAHPSRQPDCPESFRKQLSLSFICWSLAPDDAWPHQAPGVLCKRAIPCRVFSDLAPSTSLKSNARSPGGAMLLKDVRRNRSTTERRASSRSQHMKTPALASRSSGASTNEIIHEEEEEHHCN